MFGEIDYSKVCCQYCEVSLIVNQLLPPKELKRLYWFT